jgi:hypothetical protein
MFQVIRVRNLGYERGDRSQTVGEHHGANYRHEYGKYSFRVRYRQNVPIPHRAGKEIQ